MPEVYHPTIDARFKLDLSYPAGSAVFWGARSFSPWFPRRADSLPLELRLLAIVQTGASRTATRWTTWARTVARWVHHPSLLVSCRRHGD